MLTALTVPARIAVDLGSGLVVTAMAPQAAGPSGP